MNSRDEERGAQVLLGYVFFALLIIIYNYTTVTCTEREPTPEQRTGGLDPRFFFLLFYL